MTKVKKGFTLVELFSEYFAKLGVFKHLIVAYNGYLTKMKINATKIYKSDGKRYRC